MHEPVVPTIWSYILSALRCSPIAPARASPGEGDTRIAMKRPYEVTFIVRVDIDDAALNNTVEQVRGWIEADELGQVTRIDRWGRRKLAYEIDKQREGYYVLMESQIEPPALKELERNLNLSQSILRYLVVRVED